MLRNDLLLHTPAHAVHTDAVDIYRTAFQLWRSDGNATTEDTIRFDIWDVELRRETPVSQDRLCLCTDVAVKTLRLVLLAGDATTNMMLQSATKSLCRLQSIVHPMMPSVQARSGAFPSRPFHCSTPVVPVKVNKVSLCNILKNNLSHKESVLFNDMLSRQIYS